MVVVVAVGRLLWVRMRSSCGKNLRLFIHFRKCRSSPSTLYRTSRLLILDHHFFLLIRHILVNQIKAEEQAKQTETLLIDG